MLMTSEYICLCFDKCYHVSIDHWGIHSLAPGRHVYNIQLVLFTLISRLDILEFFLSKCPLMNATRPHGWIVNIGLAQWASTMWHWPKYAKPRSLGHQLRTLFLWEITVSNDITLLSDLVEVFRNWPYCVALHFCAVHGAFYFRISRKRTGILVYL